MDITSYDNCADLDAFAEAWDRLCEQEPRFIPSFSELKYQLRNPGARFRLLAATEHSQIAALACFIYRNGNKRYSVASRTLFHLPVKEVSLFGASVPGRADEETIRKFFRVVLAERDFDLVSVGEVFVDSPLYRAVTSLHGGLVSWHVMREAQVRWMIHLPGSFDEYISSLRPTAAMHIARDGRRFNRAGPEYRATKRPDEVEGFLRDAETVSRLTYQWKLGYGLCNDERTRQQLTRLARNGNLRGYIAYLHGKPCAFGWGELSHRTFSYRYTGYDPQYRNISPGTALTMQIIQDLIKNTDCRTFDFGSGGDSGYKSRLATLSPSCTDLQVAQIYRPYSLLIVALDKTINLAKNSVMDLMDLIVGNGALKQRLKRVLRRVGVGTY